MSACAAFLIMGSAACSKSAPSANSPQPSVPDEAAIESGFAGEPATDDSPATDASDSSANGAAVFDTDQGPLRLIPIQHATLALQYQGQTIWLDPWSEGDLSAAPKADYVFLTDIHQDHLDKAALQQVSQPSTVVIGPRAVADELEDVVILNNGESKQFENFSVQALPMYNLQRGPEPGKLYHEKGRGNGYLFTFSDKRIYISGDTECTPEMRQLRDVDVALVSMNLPYTMPPEEAAECVLAFKPAVALPYHHRDSDLAAFKGPVEKAGVQVQILNWYGE